MPRNLIGYFGKLGDCGKQFSVKFIADRNSDSFEEIYLAGTSPFVVTYDTTNTPFDPIRKSRASINVVANDYLLDVYTSGAHGTQVVLMEGENIMWTGFLTSNLLSMPQDSCGYSTFTMEAQDCLYTLEKFDYHTVGERKAIVTFKDIMKQIMNTCEDLNTLWVDMSLSRQNGSYIGLGDLTISEKNFFSSDTDEPWNMKQVLEELCKYLGYTATQYKDGLYLYDMQSHADYTFQSTGDTTMIMNCFKYTKADNWNSYQQGSFTNLANGVTLRQSIVMGTNSDISLETLYNKIQVKDSFYEIEEFIPDIYKEEKLTNRLGDKWKSNMLSYSGKFRYVNKNGRVKTEEKDEKDHIYYIRKYDHDNYNSIYRNKDTYAIVAVNGGIVVSNLDFNQTNSYITHDGTYDITATITNRNDTRKTITVGATLEYKWYDEDGEPVYNTNPDGITSTAFTLSAGASRQVSLHCYATFEGNNVEPSFHGYYIVDSTTYDLNQTDKTNQYIGGTIVDLATFDKPMDNSKYNYETEASIDFTKYLMIHQMDRPSQVQHPYWNWIFMQPLPGLNDNQIETYYPCVFKLKQNYTNPMIIDDKAYLAIDASAIWERYNVEYINPDWTHENTCANGLGFLTKNAEITTVTPALIFKLKVGNKYWSTQSGWTTTNCCFCCNMSTDKTDKDDVDFTEWWNEDHTILNNVSWTDWAGVKGYKIPLDETFDMNQPIEFEVHLPSIIQRLRTGYDYSGMNNYCWIKDFNLQFATKGSEIFDNSDVIYENEINSGSVNTLSDITCKFTTYPGEGMHSYSTVGLDGHILEGVRRSCLDGGVDKPEENIIKAYSNQYSTPTIKQTMTLKDYISPFSRIKDPVLNKYFGILGTTIDYANGSQTMTLIETKDWYLQ
jgi:hypothetical protein